MIKSITFKKGTLEDLVLVSHPSLWHLNHLGGEDFEFALEFGEEVRGEFTVDPNEISRVGREDLLPYVGLSIFQKGWPNAGFIHKAQYGSHDDWQYSFWTMPEDLQKKVQPTWTWGDFYREVGERLQIPPAEMDPWLASLDCGVVNFYPHG